MPLCACPKGSTVVNLCACVILYVFSSEFPCILKHSSYMYFSVRVDALLPDELCLTKNCSLLDRCEG